jgi:general secretion pathway protein C
MSRPISAVQPSYRLQSVADLSLFGSAQVAAAVGSSVEAPQTQLNLTLRGVWANPSRASARAIIAAANGSEEAYKVGDALPGGASLEQVHPDRVILKRGGRLEALYLPKESMAGVGDSAALETTPAGYASESPALGTNLYSDVGSRLQEYRQRILNNPAEVFSLARMQPVMEDGKLKGYKLSPNKEKQLFREIGLRPGDVVTSVNGLSLADPAAAGQVMTQVSSASQVTLVVDRGGREETIVVPIGK